MTRPSSLREADAAAAPGEPAAAAPPSELDLDVLMARLREEVQARKRGAASEQAASAVAETKRVRAIDLLDLPEAAFVSAAYDVVLGREPRPDEADRQIDRLLLGRVRRTALLAELLATDEARAAGARLEQLGKARRRENLMSSPLGRLYLEALNVLRTLYLLPKRIRQFVKRIEALEQRASESARRIETLEQEAQALRTALGLQTAESPGGREPARRQASASARRGADAR